MLIPIFCAPLLAMLFRVYSTARRAGVHQISTTERPGDRTFGFYFYELDIIGLLLLTIGHSLLLLSLNLNSYQSAGWRSPLIVSFVVLGPLFTVAFVVYEKYMAPKTFLPWELVKDRNVIFTNTMAATLYTSEFICSA